MSQSKCLCGIDHAKQQEMSEAFTRLGELVMRIVAELGPTMAQLGERFVPMAESFKQLGALLAVDEELPPFDTNCVKCQESLFVGATPCDLHQPAPPVVKTKKKKSKK